MNKYFLSAAIISITTSVSAQNLSMPTEDEGSILDRMPRTLDEAEQGIGKLFDRGRAFFEPGEDGQKSEAEQLTEDLNLLKDKAYQYGENLIECTTGAEETKLAGPPPVLVTQEQMNAILESQAAEYEVLSIKDPVTGIVYLVDKK